MLLTPEHLSIRDTVRRFSRDKLRPDYQKREADPGIDMALARTGALARRRGRLDGRSL